MVAETEPTGVEASATLRTRYPADAQLLAALGNLAWTKGHATAIVARQRNVYASTFPSEVVTCRFDDGSEHQVFCKYVVPGRRPSHGHRPGVPYEADVYDAVLRPLGVRPKLYGLTHRPDGETWIFVEHLSGFVPVHETASDQPAVIAAARWIASFHRANASRVDDSSLAFLSRYDGPYYAGWADRSLEASSRWRDRVPWLPELCSWFRTEGVAALATDVTIIHGEYTPSNVLFSDGEVVATDWESAAVAAGEIDVVALLDGWQAGPLARSLEAYAETRWPGAERGQTDERALVASVYWQLRWLGRVKDEWPFEAYEWRYEETRAAWQRLQLLHSGG